MDLARLVARIVGFDYEICLVKDKMYGKKLSNETWNGMIGELTREVKIMFILLIIISYFVLSDEYYVVKFGCVFD